MPALLPRAFRSLARLRSARAFHPAGALHEARADIRGRGTGSRAGKPVDQAG